MGKFMWFSSLKLSFAWRLLQTAIKSRIFLYLEFMSRVCKSVVISADKMLSLSGPLLSAQFFSSKLVPGCWRDGPCRPQRRLHGWMGRGSEGGRRGGGMRNSDLIEFWLRSFLLRCQCDNSDEVKKAGCVFESNLFTFFLLLVIPVGPCALILLATFWTLSCQLNKLGDLRISLDRITTPPQLPQV